MNNSSRVGYGFALGLFVFGVGIQQAYGVEPIDSQSLIQFAKAEMAGQKHFLTVKNASLQQVLESLSMATQTTIHYSTLPADLLNVSCEGLRLKDIFACLLGEDVNWVVRNQQSELVEIWVMDVPETGQVVKTTTQNSQPELTSSGLSVEVVNALLEQAKNPSEREAAIAGLGHALDQQDNRVKQALQRALHDHNPAVRVQAVSSLAMLAVANLGNLLEQALKDSHAEVRLMVVDQAGKDSYLLRLAAQDSDETVRQMAQTKLAALQKTD